jgi:two-component system sensor histidine kinase UhpB
LEEVRRVALDLRPTILDDLGLGPALEWRVDELNRGGGLHATLWTTGLDRRLPREVELTFYRVAQESLSNVARHAQAQSVNVELAAGDGRLRLAIIDDGCGFDPDATAIHDRRGLGLVGMSERLAMVEGQLEVYSAPGCGTRIVASAPLDFRSQPPR